MKTRDYDFNVYAPTEDRLSLAAYEVVETSAGFVVDYSSWLKIEFDTDGGAYGEEIAFLLKAADETELFEDLDAWVSREQLDNAPPVIQAWINALPGYERNN
jgi:uncharacterized protein YwgA